MFAWLASLFRRKPKPLWAYTGHEYRGIDAESCHVYLVSSQRGEERQTHVHRFHARGGDHRKADDKLAEHFRRITSARNEG